MAHAGGEEGTSGGEDESTLQPLAQAFENDNAPGSGCEGDGVTYDGKRFVIPPMRGVMTQLFLPWNWTLMQVVTWLFFVLNGYSFFCSYPPWFYYLLTLLWRLLYNVGLGFVLKKQSETQVISV